MCRIVGRVSRDAANSFQDGLRRMVESVAHGGPDDEGVYHDGGVSLGHRRLSIIDLSQAGHQPMISDSSDIVISYNGEIYNYQKLKEELEKNGATFLTRTDTEVILKAYETWGTMAFGRFEGIFSFALFDKRSGLFFWCATTLA